ncbi:MAG: hypothetical protein M3Y41_15320, partial [Pseudomonadota bacterium]|nr:hypothetical protein [Pseudomonadota bacterium]
MFASERKQGHVAAYNHIKAAIEVTLAKAGQDLPNWRLHDFRRAGVTALAGMGVAPHVADKLLNHQTGTISGVAAVYQR